MANDITTLAVAVPRSVRLRLAALQLERGHLGHRMPTVKDLVLEALDRLFADAEGRISTER